MKKIYILALASVFFFGCQHDVVEDIDFNVTLDPSNSYLKGEPVRFNFVGNMDNVVFYSGEEGSEYKYRERYTIPVENIESATLSLSVLSQYGKADALEMWVTDKFEGLWGDNKEKDLELIKSLVDSGMSDWQKIEYKDPSSGGTVEINLDILELKENFCIAFHWNPTYDGRSSQRTYKVNGEVALDIKDLGASRMDLGGLDFTAVMMNEGRDGYIADNKNGEIALNDKVYDLYFRGCNATEFQYALDGWAISRPRPLNKVANDKGLVIKNIQNYLNTYEYTWNEPGTYTVTFVGTNSNYMGASQEIKEITVTIHEKF